MQIAILDDYQQTALTRANWDALGARVVTFSSHIADTPDLVAELRPFDVVVAMRERTPFTRERIGLLPNLRLLVTTGMRNAAIDVAAARRAGITVCGTRGTAGATPELTWALILAVTRHVTAEDAAIRAGGWQHTVGFGLHGRTLGIVGLGRIGRAVAAVGRAFGMEVLAWSQHLTAAAAAEAGATAVSKDDLFTLSDVVTVHYKLSPRSAGLVGARELGLMKPTAFLVNTSRGPIVDSDALLAALRAGNIAGAGLDVYDEEPLPAGHPLRSAPRTVLTPHVGYVTDDGYRMFYGDAVEDIAAFAKGCPIRVIEELPAPRRRTGPWHRSGPATCSPRACSPGSAPRRGRRACSPGRCSRAARSPRRGPARAPRTRTSRAAPTSPRPSAGTSAGSPTPAT